MPLTKKGNRMLRRFKKQYGKRGEEVFYRYMKAHPKITRSWHKV